MVKAFMLLSFRELHSEAELVRYLHVHTMEAQALGFTCVPHRTTFHRFRERYGVLLQRMAEELRQMLPSSRLYGVDATLEWKPRDPDATWGFSACKQWVEGFKLHLLSDLGLGLPVRVEVTPANKHDSPLLPQLVAEVGMGDYVADKGYDSEINHQAIHAEGGFPAICRNKRRGDQDMPTLRNKLKNNKRRKQLLKQHRWKVEPQNELFKPLLDLSRRLCRGIQSVVFYVQLTLLRLLTQAVWAYAHNTPELARKTSLFKHT